MKRFTKDPESGYVFDSINNQWLTTAEEVYDAFYEYLNKSSEPVSDLPKFPSDGLGGIVRVERTQEELLVVLQKLREQHSEKMTNEGKRGAGLIEETRKRMASYSDEERKELEILRKELLNGVFSRPECIFNYCPNPCLCEEKCHCYSGK